MRTLPSLFLTLAFLAGCNHTDASRPSTISPAWVDGSAHAHSGTPWERVSSPESAGFTSQGIENVRRYLRTLDTTSLMVVVGGKVLMAEGDTSEVSYLASARKSVLAMLYGNYVASGRVHLESTLKDLGIDDLGGLTDEERTATIADLLTARSGVYHPASNPGDDLIDAPPRGSRPHGTYFLYSNWDFNALGTIFERTTGRDIYDALQTDLAERIGMEDFRRDLQQKRGDATKSTHLAYHMKLSTRDMARLGLLMLRQGKWAGQQVVPAQWIRQMVHLHVPLEQMNPPKIRSMGLGYGYLWWIFDGPGSRAGGAFAGAYSAIGAYGQFITVVPKLDLVIAHKTRPEGTRDVSVRQYRRLVELIVSARVEPGAPSPDAANQGVRPQRTSLAFRSQGLAPKP